MIRILTLTAAAALISAPAMAEGMKDRSAELDAPRSISNQEPAEKSAADTEGEGQLSEYWQERMPMTGESYGMFPQLYGNPHDNQVIEEARREAAGEDADSQVADTGAGTHAGEASGNTILEPGESVEETAEISPAQEGPDLRDATGGERVD